MFLYVTAVMYGSTIRQPTAVVISVTAAPGTQTDSR